MDDCNLAGEFGQVFRFLDSSIAASDDSHMHITIKRSITGPAIGNTFSSEFMFTRNIESVSSSAGADNECLTADLSSVVQNKTFPMMITEINTLHFSCQRVEVKAFCMGGHFLNQIKSRNSIGKSWIIINPIGKENLAARGSFFDHYMIESCPGSIKPSRETCRASAKNDELIMIFLHEG